MLTPARPAPERRLRVYESLADVENLGEPWYLVPAPSETGATLDVSTWPEAGHTVDEPNVPQCFIKDVDTTDLHL